MVNRTKQKHRKREKHKREKHKRGKHKRGKHKTNNQKRKTQKGGSWIESAAAAAAAARKAVGLLMVGVVPGTQIKIDPDNYIILVLIVEEKIFNIYIPKSGITITEDLNIMGKFHIVDIDGGVLNNRYEVEQPLEHDSTTIYMRDVINYLLSEEGGNYQDTGGTFNLFKFIDAGLVILIDPQYERLLIDNAIELPSWVKKGSVVVGTCIIPQPSLFKREQDMRYKLHISVKKEFIGAAVTKFQEFLSGKTQTDLFNNYKVTIPNFRHSEYKTVDGAKEGYNSLPPEYKKDLLTATANIVIYPSTLHDIDTVVTRFKKWWLQNFENRYTGAPRDENYMMFNFRIPGTRTLFFAYGADTGSRLYEEDGYTFIEPSVIKNLKSWYCSDGVPKDNSNVPECLKDSLNIDESNYNEFCSNEAFPPANQSLGARFGMDGNEVWENGALSKELKELNQICNTWGHWFKRGLNKCVSRGTCTTQKPWELSDLDESMNQPVEVDRDGRGGGGKMKHKKSKRKSRSKRKKKTRKPKNSRKPRKPKQTKRKKKNK